MAAVLELDPEQLGCAADKGGGAYDRTPGSPLQIHPAAMRAACDLIDRMYQSGLLDFLRGLASSGSEIADKLAEGAAAEQTIRAIRNGMTLMTILGRLDPGVLQRISHPTSEVSAPNNGTSAELLQEDKPIGWLALLRRLSSTDSRRGVALLINALESIGRAARSAEIQTKANRTHANRAQAKTSA